MAKVAKKPITKKTNVKKITKPMTKKTVCKCGGCKSKQTKVQKVSIKSVKTSTVPIKKSFWAKVAEFFRF